jgi:hypothetical protein
MDYLLWCSGLCHHKVYWWVFTLRMGMLHPYCHVLQCDCGRGCGLEIGFVDHFITQLVIILNYNAIASFHTLQIPIAHAKSFPARSVSISSFLVTASNNEYSAASVLKSSLNVGSLPTEHSCNSNLVYVSQTNWPSSNLVPCLNHLGTDQVENTFPLLHAYPLLRGRFYRAIPSSLRLFLLIKNLLPSNGRRNISLPLPRNECCFRAVR